MSERSKEVGEVCHDVADAIDSLTELSPQTKLPGDGIAVVVHVICDIAEKAVECYDRPEESFSLPILP